VVPFDRFEIPREKAEEILSEGFGRKVKVRFLERMSGGMICSVFHARLGTKPVDVVLKLKAGKAGSEDFEHQFRVLDFLKKNTEFPVPKPYFFCAEKSKARVSALVLEFLPGVNLGECSFTPSQRKEIDEQIALSVVDLHKHRRETFGGIFEESRRTWVEVFRKKMEDTLPACKQRLDKNTFTGLEEIVDCLEHFFKGRDVVASLVHGDIWATNVIVDVKEGKAFLSGFVDPSAIYADPEYELAYLEVFRTVGEEFFRIYQQYFRIDPGYEVRRTLYHLHTMLVHVKVFSDASYIRRTEQLVNQLLQNL